MHLPLLINLRRWCQNRVSGNKGYKNDTCVFAKYSGLLLAKVQRTINKEWDCWSGESQINFPSSDQWDIFKGPTYGHSQLTSIFICIQASAHAAVLHSKTAECCVWATGFNFLRISTLISQEWLEGKGFNSLLSILCKINSAEYD